MSFYPGRYAEDLCDVEGEFTGRTEGDKVLIGLWMIADALADIRRAIGPTDVGDIHKANIVEGMMKSADILGERIETAASYITSAVRG